MQVWLLWRVMHLCFISSLSHLTVHPAVIYGDAQLHLLKQGLKQSRNFSLPEPRCGVLLFREASRAQIPSLFLLALTPLGVVYGGSFPPPLQPAGRGPGREAGRLLFKGRTHSCCMDRRAGRRPRLPSRGPAGRCSLCGCPAKGQNSVATEYGEMGIGVHQPLSVEPPLCVVLCQALLGVETQTHCHLSFRRERPQRQTFISG